MANGHPSAGTTVDDTSDKGWTMIEMLATFEPDKLGKNYDHNSMRQDPVISGSICHTSCSLPFHYPRL
jgi:hypothetical protein